MSEGKGRAGVLRLLEGLTEPQRRAVTHTDGPLLVLAGAGSGKTRVITRRAGYLARTVTRPHNVLAITFTNKAANEMRERIAALGVGRGMTVCTFHSLCARLLRTHHDRAGIAANFTIFDEADRKKVLAEAIKRCDLSTTNWSPARVQAVISNAKNRLETPDVFAEAATDWAFRCIARIYQAYEKILTEQQGLDFDDLLLRMALLLRRDAELCEQLESRYTHLLIDEYQDTNQAQYEIAHAMTRAHRNLCATGDPDQSIYGWRGADIRNILRFEEDYPDATVVRLEQNYRSSKRILSAAGRVIACNTQRKEKELWTQNPEGRAVRAVTCPDETSEAELIADEIRGHRTAGRPLKEIAVFYRINALSRSVEEALLSHGIAYQVARGVEFYNRKEIKDVLAYLRVMINPADEVSLLRIINTPTRGIGATTVKRLQAVVSPPRRPLFDVIANAADVPGLGRAAARVRAFAELLGKLKPLAAGPPRAAVEAAVMETGMNACLTEEAAVNPEPLANVGELISAAATYESENSGSTLLDFLEHTSLLSDVDAVDPESGAVTLMTLHAAKGLEFPIVYVVGLEDGLLPFSRMGADTDDEEEERRLFFVGMTRAKEELTLLHARYRTQRGVTERQIESIFLSELPDEEIDWVEHDTEDAEDPPGRKPRGRLPDDIELWETGTVVRHPEHGLGRVQWMRPGGGATRIGLRFESGEEKTFVLEYADLERVDYHEVE